MDDKQVTLMQHLSLISNVFEAAVQYMQSLQVSYLAAKRVFDMSHALLACHPSSSANYADNDFVSYHGQHRDSYACNKNWTKIWGRTTNGTSSRIKNLDKNSMSIRSCEENKK